MDSPVRWVFHIFPLNMFFSECGSIPQAAWKKSGGNLIKVTQLHWMWWWTPLNPGLKVWGDMQG